tara:strand:- start:786 stop:1259 length:474 start_codon:yes stop_codon:yes gene_type:complete
MAGPAIPLLIRGLSMGVAAAGRIKGGKAIQKELANALAKAQRSGATTADLSAKAKRFLTNQGIPHRGRRPKPRNPKGETYTKKPGQGGYGDKSTAKFTKDNKISPNTKDFGKGSKTDDVVTRMAKNEKRYQQAQSVSSRKTGGRLKKKPQSGHNRLY